MSGAKDDVTAIDFHKWFISDGYGLLDDEGNPAMVEDDDGNPTSVQYLDVDKISEKFGVSSGVISNTLAPEGGWNNPTRGRTYNGLVEVAAAHGIDEAHLKAWLQWRAKMWTNWDEAGKLSEGDEGFDASRDNWDETTDFAEDTDYQAFLEDAIAFFSDKPEETPDSEEGEEGEGNGETSDEDFSLS